LSIGSMDESSNKTTGSGSSVPSGSAGALGNTAVSAGKYVAEGVYVGVDQSVTGESRAKVEVEITPHISVNTTESAERGNSLGVNWKLDY